jgi:hypothetical protein
MIDEDEIEDKEISEEIAELMKGQGMNDADGGAAIDILDEERPVEEDEDEEKAENTAEDDANEV